MELADLWLLFVGAGLFLILLELVLGVETGFDLVFIGSAFILGGLVTWPFNSWLLTVIVTSLICVVYVVIGRRYIHQRMAVKKVRTNVDTIIGSRGIVLKDIARNFDGQVKLGNQRWRARSEEDIGEGNEVVVKSISGSTLIVEKEKGGNGE